MRHKLTFYSTSSFPLFKDYMETRRSEWEEYKYFTAEHVRDMSLKKYKNLLPSGRWSTKDPNDSHILALVIVAQELADESKKFPIGIPLRERNPTSGTSHPGC